MITEICYCAEGHLPVRRWILIGLGSPPRVLETALLEHWHFTWLIIPQWLSRRWPTEPIRWQEWACRLPARRRLFPSERTFQPLCSSGQLGRSRPSQGSTLWNICRFFFCNMKQIKKKRSSAGFHCPFVLLLDWPDLLLLKEQHMFIHCKDKT